MRAWSLCIAVLVFLSFVSCHEATPLEKGMEAYSRGAFDAAIRELQLVQGEQKAQAEELIAKAKEEQAKQDVKACQQLVEDRYNLIAEARTTPTFDRIMQKLKTMTCPGDLDISSYVVKGYVAYLTFLTDRGQPEDYVDAVAKYCEIDKCDYKEPRSLIYEEVVELTDPDGKKRKEVLQNKIPMVDHARALAMFQWLMKADAEHIEYMDRYARFLNRLEQFDIALETFTLINSMEDAPFEVKDRARLMVDHLKARRKPERKPGEQWQYFWAEDAKAKSVIKGLKPELETPAAQINAAPDGSAQQPKK